MSFPVFDLPIIGPSNAIAQDDPQFTRNMYAEKVNDEEYTLKPTPGTELSFALSQNGGGRNEINVNERYFAVRGSFLIERVAGVSVLRGTLLSGNGKVGMIFNNPPSDPPNFGGQILIVDEDKAYCFFLSDNTFVPPSVMEIGGTVNGHAIVGGFVGGLSQAVFCAGRAFCIKPGTAQYQFSALYDFTTWSGIDAGFATCLSLLNGSLKGILSNGDLLYLWSQFGMEVWQKGAANAESPNPMGLILNIDKIGIVAPNSAFFIGRFAYWLGGSQQGQGVIYRHAGGGEPERISDHSTERNIAALENPEDANAISYQSLGHTFYLLTFRKGNRTFCFDATTLLWHERSQRNPDNAQEFALPFVSLVILNGEILGLDYRNGDVWKISDTVYSDNDNPITRDRILPPVPKEGDSVSVFQSIELMGEKGNTPLGQEIPNVMFRYSADRGKTWSQERWRPIGSDFGYLTRTRWVGLGSGLGFTPWFRFVGKQYISWRLARLRAT